MSPTPDCDRTPHPNRGLVAERLNGREMRWLVTGAAGFIGSHLVRRLLELGQFVRGLDNFSTGKQRNIDAAVDGLLPTAAARLEFMPADIRDDDACAIAARDVDIVLHQAAIASVPASIEHPRETCAVNTDGTLALLLAGRKSGVKRFVFASSSAVYGDAPELPARESALPAPISPYAASKLAAEEFAFACGASLGTSSIALRYFNVFGPRQDPRGAYAAVISAWISAAAEGRPMRVNGDGENTRDFCHVDNVVNANLLAALAPPEAANTAYNIGSGTTVSLNGLLDAIVDEFSVLRPDLELPPPEFHEPRAGDIRHSSADITKARHALGYETEVPLEIGLRDTIRWFLAERDASDQLRDG